MAAYSIHKPFRIAALLCVAILAITGCKKSDTNNAAPGAAPGQPAAAAAARGAAPAAPTGPVPSYSAANKVGLYAYPGKGQSHDQQLIDESDCYNSAQQQTGVNPDMAAPQAPTSAEVQAAQSQAAESAPEQ